MKTILALVLAALIVNASVRLGDSFWRQYQLEDAVSQEARFGNSKTASDLRKRLVKIAADHEVPVTEEDVTVERRGIETYVSLQYAEDLELVPRLYTHEQVYDITMSVEPVRPLTDH